MIYKHLNRFLSFILIACILTACIYDEFSIDIDDESQILQEDIYDGYSLNVVVTLDNMGGVDTRAVLEPNPMQDRENYVDPEKFRVLFFDNEDKFLFESKSRWVRKLPDLDHSRWLVSVPVFTYGNDEQWNWSSIRESLTTQSFKIAILANRPEMEWYPGFKNTGLPEKADWYDNTGPHWGPEQTGIKDVFDLHHCQYDMIYHGKSESNGYYDFIMGDYNKNEDGNITTAYDAQRPQMGATSSWVEWADISGKNDSHGWEKRPTILPDTKHPIPMYGIQEFEKIEGWQEGTPFNLSDMIPGDNLNQSYQKRSISLLRSVVKVELRIPTTVSKKPDFVGLCYANIYARCEPLDVWTPTDQLWSMQHDDGMETDCEFYAIRKYGPIAKPIPTSYSSKRAYQKTLSWFYGIWSQDKQWDFNKTYTNFNDLVSENEGGTYPRIFNPCIQRNGLVICDDNGDLSYNSTNAKLLASEKYANDGYYHYVAYVGERNLNDPSDLSKIDDTGGGKATVMYWIFNINNQVYGIPITDYSIQGNPALKVEANTDYTYSSTNIADENYYMNASNGQDKTKNDAGKGKGNDYSYSRRRKIDNIDQDVINPDSFGYMLQIMDVDKVQDAQRPWPLIRNHIYCLTLRTSNNREPGSPPESRAVKANFDIDLEVRHSKSLKFN